MKIERLKIGQEIWIHNGEFPTKEIVCEVDLDANEVWLSDGNPYHINELHSTEKNCKENN